MKLSIITINRNNAIGLKKTIESVVCQTFKYFEYIIIDGASADESVNVIKKFLDNISYWISEPDSGVYDAMNKGIKIAGGEYCLFLNSGDYLSSNFALEKAFEFDFFEDIVYGNIIFENYLNERMIRKCNSKLSILNFFTGSNWGIINHQNCFIKRSLFLEYGFYRTDLQIVSDQAFLIKAIFECRVSYRYIPIAISVYDLTGISSKNGYELVKELDAVTSDFLKYPELHNSLNSIAFYDKVWDTPGVKFWYETYLTIQKFISKIKRFFGKDFYYNANKFFRKNEKKEENKMLFSPKKIHILKNKKLIIWGTGDDGMIVYNYCLKHKIFAHAFLDSNEQKQKYAIDGRPVFAPKFAFENKGKNFFIAISSRKYCEEIANTCKEMGFEEGVDFCVPFTLR
jgi:glycosyltransferase involved in cell wall biosynthesis